MLIPVLVAVSLLIFFMVRILPGDVISDILGIEQNLASKYQTYSQMCQDTDLANKFSMVAGRHQKHFDTLSKYLNPKS